MRDLNLLHPILKEKAEELIVLAKDRFNLRVFITQTRRTDAEQKALFAQGRDSLENVNYLRKGINLAPITSIENTRTITNAKSNSNSFHGYGLAFDIAISDPTGKKIDWTNKSDWNGDGLNDWAQVGSLADELDLEWGGNWSGMCDPPHFQDRMGFTLAQLQKGDGVPESISLA